MSEPKCCGRPMRAVFDPDGYFCDNCANSISRQRDNCRSTEITKCLGLGCPWRKECVRFTEEENIKRGETVFVSPHSKEGCAYFLTPDMLEKKFDKKTKCK